MTRPTPITDRLMTDLAIERRDVPTRVWRAMMEIESQRDELVAALEACYENMRITADLTKRKWTQRDQNCFEKARAALARIKPDA